MASETARNISASYGIFSEFKEVGEFCITWSLQEAITPGRYPRFEELALGGLGPLADDVALMGAGRENSLEIYYGGRAIENWLGVELRGASLEKIEKNLATALRETIDLALARRHPAMQALFCLRDGLVMTREIVIFPLSRKSGATVFLLFSRERAHKYNIVEAIYRATGGGLVTLAAVQGETRDAISDFRILSLNDGAARLLGASELELCWRRLSEAAPSFARDGTLARLIELFDKKNYDEFEIQRQTAEGSLRHLRISAAPMGDLMALTLTDVTRIKSREESFRLLFQENPMPMWVHDPSSRRFLAVNEAAIVHFGLSREQFLDVTLESVFAKEEWSALEKGGKDWLEKGATDRIWRARAAQGRPIEMQTYARELEFGGRPAMLVSVVDVTEQQAAAARIAHMAHHDSLTGLPNRSQFRTELGECLAALRPGEGLAAHYVDLDNFKFVNDALGHPAGDKLLVAVARRLTGVLRPSDRVARLGGDEFAFLQSGVRSPDDAAIFAGAIVAALNRPFEIEGQEIGVGASVGVALAPIDASDPDALLQFADIALYQVKREGGKIYRLFDSSMAATVMRRRALEADLREALAHDNFELHYRPIVDIGTGAVVAMEALLRWSHPARGPVSPSEFIPIAEGAGLIIPIGERVLRNACLEAMNWPHDARVCVNLSPAQFKSLTLVQSVIRALNVSGLPASRLELEITETVLLAESRANISILHQLRDIGVRISLDDFGTGNSSLTNLRAFPFDKIKIDRSFVAELPDNRHCVAIVRAVAGIGQCLDVAVVAEGVETHEQLEILRKEGCTQIQGYLFARPAPAEVARKLFDAARVEAAA
jgi:diguanylate cyclase (GGDEF)-like protein/PAS domain S-box-containing protein